MGLEQLLKPVKALNTARKILDEEVLRQYTKLTKKWEDKGRNIFKLTTPIGLASVITAVSSIYFTPSSLYLTETNPLIDSVIISTSFIYAPDMALNIIGLAGLYNREEITSDTVTSKRPFRSFIESVGRFSRLPVLLGGVGFLVKFGIDYGNYVITKEPLDVSEMGLYLTLGTSFLSYASSVYLKDGNPKLLDKEPFLKTASNWLIEKITPKVAQPARFQTYPTLDNYSQTSS